MLLEQIDGKLLAEAARIAEDKTVEHAIEDAKAEKEPMTPHVSPNGVLADTIINLYLSMEAALKEHPDMASAPTFLIGVISTGLTHGIRVGIEYERLRLRGNDDRPVERVST